MLVLARPQTPRTKKPNSGYGREEIPTKLGKSPPRLQLLTMDSPRVHRERQLYAVLSVVPTRTDTCLDANWSSDADDATGHHATAIENFPLRHLGGKPRTSRKYRTLRSRSGIARTQAWAALVSRGGAVGERLPLT